MNAELVICYCLLTSARPAKFNTRIWPKNVYFAVIKLMNIPGSINPWPSSHSLQIQAKAIIMWRP